MTTQNDITEIGTYEVHPAADRNGVETGWWAVVQTLTSEVVAKFADRDEAIADATGRANRATELTTRARCFRGANGGVGILDEYAFMVDPDGTVRVYDSIAGHYTIHHGMTTREESRVRNLARR